MNKLQEAGNKVRERILSLADSEDIFDYGALDMIEETVREVCLEYARSVINIETNPLIELPLSDYIRLESAWDKKHKEMFSRINLDLQSLNN